MLVRRPNLIVSLPRIALHSYATSPEEKYSLEPVNPSEKLITPENQHAVISDIVTPLANMDYLSQLKVKKKWSGKILRKIKEMPIPKVQTTLHTIIPSPVVDHYRNKDEFSIRTGVDGNPKTVGYFAGSPAKGDVVCIGPKGLKNMKPHHTKLAEVFQELVRESPLKACHDLHDGGFWRSITVRSNQKGDTMVVIVTHPNGASKEEEEGAKLLIKERFLDYNVTSLFYQSSPHTRAPHDVVPYELLMGEPHIYEWIGEYRFRISPDSFFQVNVEAAPLLYDKAIHFVDPSPKSTLLDLCCGTGTVSIFASKMFRGCVGIDAIKHAIDDAEFNASSNHVFNCHFTTGLVEKSLGRILSELDMSPELSAILNPGRSGCNKRVTNTLRQSLQIRNLVYISCKADHPNVMSNFYELSHPKFDGVPFQLTDVQPVDMFPHTNHCELMLVFRR
uniref:tRNA (uracil(54)-C(5))-methyltransferase n=2 Tax=Lygus hesperus TaxID=30085 RepID=A0A0A9W7P9_LYGHE